MTINANGAKCTAPCYLLFTYTLHICENIGILHVNICNFLIAFIFVLYINVCVYMCYFACWTVVAVMPKLFAFGVDYMF